MREDIRGGKNNYKTKENTTDKEIGNEINLELRNNLLFENRIAIGQELLPLEKLRWLSTSEAAQYLRVSIGSIKNMVYRGRLSPRKLGRLNRFLRDDLERALNSPFRMKGEL